MKELNWEEIKTIQLNILNEVASFCDNHKIEYFLCGGTLLGAIRHKGYIPWDDDIDLMLPRPEYEKLMINFESKHLKLYHSKLTPEYNRPFAKIADIHSSGVGGAIKGYKLGVNIDIFPIDGFADAPEIIATQIRKIRFYRNLLFLKYMRNSKKRNSVKKIFLNLTGLVLSFVPKRFLLGKISSLSQQYNFEESNKAGIAVWGYGKREVCPQKVFTGSIMVDFENFKFKAPKDYHTYLSTVYGDYMKLPPEEKRITHHEFKYFAD